ncbi:MAG: amidase family protein, partial [Actinomycetota bacterium]|nr:amidase family protein [Actinomycetota bacterium]
MTEDLLLLPATELARRLRARELSARELLATCLDRVAEVDPVVNAVVTLDAEGATAQAAALDEQLVRSGPVGVLHGLPVGHKDPLLTVGLRTTSGGHGDHVPDVDAVLAARVRAAGGVRVGKTNVPEFVAGSQTTNAVFGATRNPHDPSRTPGGSSGGAAAALATGMVALADGSDMGGSLRNPASFCGVVGLRPTPGRVPNVPTRDAWFDLSVLGPMGRTVADAALLLSAVAGPDLRDPLSLPEPGATYLQDLERDLRGVTMAWGGDLGLPYEPEVLEAYDAARPAVESLGVRLADAAPDLAGADEVFRVLRGWHMATAIGEEVERSGDRVAAHVRGNVAYGRTVTADDLGRAVQRRTALIAAAGAFLAEHEYLLLPVSQVLPFDVGTLWPASVGGVDQPDYLGWMRSAYLVSVLGVPAASVPAGTVRGLPVGLQVVGRRGDDLGVLQVAHA